MYYAPLGARARNRNLQRLYPDKLACISVSAPEDITSNLLSSQDTAEVRAKFPKIDILLRDLSHGTTGNPPVHNLMRHLRSAYISSNGLGGDAAHIKNGLREIEELAHQGITKKLRLEVGRYGLSGVSEDIHIAIGATRESREIPGGLDVFVAPLAGLALVGQTNFRTGIEPVVLGPEGTPGLLPEGLSVWRGVINPVLYAAHEQA